MLASDARSLTINRRVSSGLSPSKARRHLEASREALAYRYGEYFDSYLVTEPGREEFWSSSMKGFISYARRGHYVVVGGGLIAADANKEELLKEFVESLRAKKLVGSFHNIGDDEVPLFRKYGFQITKWGEEPMVDLGAITWSGKAFEWVRRQTNFCQRHGLKAFEIRYNEATATVWSHTIAEMREVSAECLAQKAQQEMKFFEGRIGDHAIGRRRVFIVRGSDGLGRMEGFMVCTPMRNGTRWATELYRRRNDAVRGTMAFLFRHVLQQMQDEGVQCVGLCLDPGLRCGEKLPGDSALIRLGMTWGETWLNFILDVPGIRHFKSRFRPRYESRYVCVTPRATIRSILAFARVCGLLTLNPWKVLRISIERFWKRAQRRTLDDLE